MSTDLVRVGIREFREDLARYLDEGTPVAITRHGQTVGFFLPVPGSLAEPDLAAFREAAVKRRTLLADRETCEDDVVREFRARRERD